MGDICKASVRNMPSHISMVVQGTRAVMEALAKVKGVRRLVYTSTVNSERPCLP